MMATQAKRVPKHHAAMPAPLPEHERLAAESASHGFYGRAARDRNDSTAAMRHEQLAALYADAAHVALHLHTTAERGAEMRGRLARLKVEIASIQRDGAL